MLIDYKIEYREINKNNMQKIASSIYKIINEFE